MNIGSSIYEYSPISATAASAGSAVAKEAGAEEELGKDEFLQLLITQLQNQDPLDPVKNEDYIAQLATFSSLEQLIAIKDAVNRLAGIETKQSMVA
jgi:flagellar basal-body rod modification protein FlgD